MYVIWLSHYHYIREGGKKKRTQNIPLIYPDGDLDDKFFVAKVKFADLSGNVGVSGREKKNGSTEEMSADSSLSHQFEGNRFNHFMKHQRPKTASAILYPIHIIGDLGHMAVPRCIMGQVDWEERETKMVVCCCAQGRRHDGVTGLGSCGLAWQILYNPPTSPMAMFTVRR